MILDSSIGLQPLRLFDLPTPVHRPRVDFFNELVQVRSFLSTLELTLNSLSSK